MQEPFSQFFFNYLKMPTNTIYLCNIELMTLKNKVAADFLRLQPNLCLFPFRGVLSPQDFDKITFHLVQR